MTATGVHSDAWWLMGMLTSEQVGIDAVHAVGVAGRRIFGRLCALAGSWVRLILARARLSGFSRSAVPPSYSALASSKNHGSFRHLWSVARFAPAPPLPSDRTFRHHFRFPLRYFQL